jgi:isoleucyl-tRNA synthetase
MLRMLWNSYSFFVLYANIDEFEPDASQKLQTTNLLDKWIVSELNVLIKDVNESMEKYELNRTVKLFPKFIDNLSNWYIRRSRKRFWKSEDDDDKNQAYQTLHYVLVELSKLMAPFTPFVAEEIYRNLTNEESVHLVDFPLADEKLIDEKLNEEMGKTRSIITEALQLRAKAGIKVRQPLSELRIKNYELREEFLDIIQEEVNIKKASFDQNIAENIELNTEITEDLKLEGQAREIIRFVQEMRKEAGYEVENRIEVFYQGMENVFAKFGKIIQKETLANKLENIKNKKVDLEKEFNIDGEKIILQIKR